MPTPQPGNKVKIHYTGSLTDGTVFDSSREREPLEFTIGAGQVIPGFEEAILPLNPGESVTVVIPPEKAYGPRHEEMIVRLPKSQFPAHLAPAVGVKFQVPQEDGRLVLLTVTDMNDEEVTLDANHDLAGKELTFQIELVEIL